MTKIIRHIVLLFFLLLSAYPLVWMCLTAFRRDSDVLEHPFALPERIEVMNFITVLQQGGFRTASGNGWLLLLAAVLATVLFLWMRDMVCFHIRLWHLPLYICLATGIALFPSQAYKSAPCFAMSYINSLLLCSISVTIAIMLAEAAAFSFARLRFRLRSMLFMTFLLGMMIPVHVTLIPLNLLLGQQFLNLKGTLLALACPYIAFALPVSILILRNAFAQIPNDLMEAARIDGCNAWHVFREVALPLARPAISTVLIFNFLTSWNEFAFALTLSNSRTATLPIALNNFKGEQGSLDIPVMCAALAITVIPMLLVYIFAQKHIINGLTAGAVKE
ncbi:MAG: carbohydrate ABC transporter permease [Victivallales bacterium]|nr:carbohydrate ABC transporter permease [Victivallales bacterium]